MRFVKRSAAIVGLLATLFALGCGSRQAMNPSGPATVPLRGKVVFTKGGDIKMLFNKQARIELESVEQPTIHAAGAIEEDGSFMVATITPDGGNMGAIAGMHRVRLDLDDSAQKFVAPQFLDFVKSGITIKAPAEDAVVQIWR